MPLMEIRKFNIADARRISELIRRNLLTVNSRFYPRKVVDFMVSFYTPQKVRELASERRIFVAIEDQSIIGTASLGLDKVYNVFVDPGQHGRGIGRILMGHIESLALSQKIRMLSLDASLNAIPFYEKLGYIRGKLKSSPYCGDTCEMFKTLTGTKKNANSQPV